MIYEYDIATDSWATISTNSFITTTMGIAFSNNEFLFYLSDKVSVMAPSNFC